MILPPSPCLTICRAAAWLSRNTALMFRFMTSSQSFSENSRKSARRMMPALFNQNIQAAQACHCLVNHSLRRACGTEVKLDGSRLSAKLPDEVKRRRAINHIHRRNIGARLRQRNRHSLPQTPRSTGDYRHLSIQFELIKYPAHTFFLRNGLFNIVQKPVNALSVP